MQMLGQTERFVDSFSRRNIIINFFNQLRYLLLLSWTLRVYLRYPWLGLSRTRYLTQIVFHYVQNVFWEEHYKFEKALTAK